MFYTVTLSPSLDYRMVLHHMLPGSVNRAEEVRMLPGGKGVNVSAVLKELGKESILLGFLAGFTGEEIEKRLAGQGLQCRFLRLKEGCSRINVEICTEEETKINASGPLILPEDVNRLKEQLTDVKKGDTLVLAGKIPSCLAADTYRLLAKEAAFRQARIVVDAEKEQLLSCLALHPFLIKPNRSELEEIAGRKLSDREEVVKEAEKLQEAGAENVMVSLGKDGAILCAASGEILFCSAPQGKVVSTVGSGDSAVAGFLAGYEETGSFSKALELACAAGSAGAFCEYLADGQSIRKLAGQIKAARVRNAVF